MLEGKKEKLFEVVQSTEVPQIISLFHDSAGHPGMNATIISIKEKYYWCGLNKDVKDHVSWLYCVDSNSVHSRM